jgi:soluble lytic murein transglycosylase-like protein
MAYAPAESAGAGQGAWGAIERATQSGWHSASFETREPASSTSAASSATGLRGMVARHAAANGVPFALADAVVRIESGYNPRARNASGAMGLMQIKTQTARGQGFAGSANGLLDAETNIRFGMRYLATAYRMAGGDVCGTVMRYQSGHGARRMSGADRSYCSKARSLMARL